VDQAAESDMEMAACTVVMGGMHLFLTYHEKTKERVFWWLALGLLA
jgi:hypothetical protein